MRRIAGVWILAVAFAAGCGSSSEATKRQAQVETGAAGQWAGTCPLDIEDTMVETEDTFEGIEVVFRTDEDGSIAMLRQSVQSLAEQYDSRYSEEGMRARQYSSTDATKEKSGTGDAARGERDREQDIVRSSPTQMTPSARERMSPESGSRYEALPSYAPVPARTRVETVSDGARIRFMAADPAQRNELRSQVRDMVQRMQETGRCEVGAPTGRFDRDDEILDDEEAAREIEETGEQIEEGVEEGAEETGEELRETGREVEEGLEEGAEETDEELRETGREIERGADEVEDELDPDDPD